MARISGIWAQSIVDFVAIQNFDFTPDQAGHNAAETYLLGKGGGILYVGAGLEGLTLSTAGNIVVVQTRSSSTPGREYSQDLILWSGKSLRMKTADGVRHTVLTSLVTDQLRLAWLSALGLTITDQNSVEKLGLLPSRIKFPAGSDFAPNNLPGAIGAPLLSAGPAAAPTWGAQGTVGQVYTSQGAGVLPIFQTPAAGGNRSRILPITIWNNGPGSPQTGGGFTKYFYDSESGSTDTFDVVQYFYPADFHATVSWQIVFTPTGDFGGVGGTKLITYMLSMIRWTAGVDIAAAAFVDGATANATPPSALNVVGYATVPEPAISPVAGECVWIKKSRLGSSDTSTFASKFLALIHNYN